jgi:DNA polymerase III delta prime subunit
VNLDSLSDLKGVATNTHFAIFVLPKKYGLSEARAALASKNTVFIEPKVHNQQKTATVNVDDILELERITRTKQQNRLGIVVVGTEKMGEQAQNKFLKLLEEPGSNIHFSFVTEDASNLLDTVLSRGQVYHIRKISKAASQALAKELLPDISAQALQQTMFLAAGLPGEIRKLATDQTYMSNQIKLVGLAKTLLTDRDLEVVKVAYGLKDDRAQALQVLDLAITIAKEALRKNPSLVGKLSELEQAYGQIAANGNIRLGLVGNLLV